MIAGQPENQQYVVWWYETDEFNGKQTRNYRDFYTASGAISYATSRQPGEGIVYVGEIAEQTWHHRHATYVLKKDISAHSKP